MLTFLCLLWFDTNAKVNVLCINCKFEDTRDWQGRIIGKGIHGSLNALLIRMRDKLLKDTPLMRLLTICVECSGEGVRIEEKNYEAWID